jgi:hypothetical protein
MHKSVMTAIGISQQQQAPGNKGFAERGAINYPLAELLSSSEFPVASFR